MNNQKDNIGQEIALRPRFTKMVPQSLEDIIEAFEKAKLNANEVVVTIATHHIFLKIPKAKQHFWSPQLDLEIYPTLSEGTPIKAIFGPKPTVWTLFMFLHFVVVILFLGFGIWAYSQYTLKQPYALPLFLMLFMILIWWILYLAGRLGKNAGKKEMLLLLNFFEKVINT